MDIETGWAVLVDGLLNDIGRVIGVSGATVELRQIKEKLGSLRLYYRLHDKATRLAIYGEISQQGSFKAKYAMSNENKIDRQLILDTLASWTPEKGKPFEWLPDRKPSDQMVWYNSLPADSQKLVTETLWWHAEMTYALHQISLI